MPIKKWNISITNLRSMGRNLSRLERRVNRKNRCRIQMISQINIWVMIALFSLKNRKVMRFLVAHKKAKRSKRIMNSSKNKNNKETKGKEAESREDNIDFYKNLKIRILLARITKNEDKSPKISLWESNRKLGSLRSHSLHPFINNSNNSTTKEYVKWHMKPKIIQDS